MNKKIRTNHILNTYSTKNEHVIIGLMSGTSLDGVDAVLVRMSGEDKPSLLHHVYLPYSKEMRAKISDLCQIDSARITDLVDVHFGLSHWYATVIDSLLRESGYESESVDAISMHGQTVWHSPIPIMFPGPVEKIKITGTLQLGNASLLAQLTSIPVISDFRSADMAVGGQGAPLAPFSDYMLFGSADEGRIIQNIGGIGNATVLPKENGEESVFAYDTGPGNMIIDEIVSIHTHGDLLYDDKGSIGKTGRVDEEIINLFMQDGYYSMKPPKSTGREVYGKEFTLNFLKMCNHRNLSFADSVATATAYTAETIVASYKDFILPSHSISRVLVCGGGALNLTLLEMIQTRLGHDIVVGTTNEYGIPDQCREAMAFAIMGHRSLLGESGNLPQVTGARIPVVLGTITL